MTNRSTALFYSQLPGIDIEELLWFVAEKTGFLGSFTHVLDRYVKQDPDPRDILACIVAMGTNMGLQKMADVSGLSHTALQTTARNYLRTETLHPASDAICNAIAALPLFQNVRGDDVFLVQPTCPPVNDHIMELLIMVDALSRASARRIT